MDDNLVRGMAMCIASFDLHKNIWRYIDVIVTYSVHPAYNKRKFTKFVFFYYLLELFV